MSEGEKFDSAEFLRRLKIRRGAIAKVRDKIADAVRSECALFSVYHVGTSVTPRAFSCGGNRYLVIEAHTHLALVNDNSEFVVMESIGGTWYGNDTLDESCGHRFWKIGWRDIQDAMVKRAKKISDNWMDDPRRIVPKKGRKKRA